MAVSALLRQIDNTRNRARFYSVLIGYNLFGEPVIIREWGRIGTRGRQRTDVYDCTSDAVTAYNRLIRSKQKKGYHLIDNHLTRRSTASQGDQNL